MAKQDNNSANEPVEETPTEEIAASGETSASTSEAAAPSVVGSSATEPTASKRPLAKRPWVIAGIAAGGVLVLGLTFAGGFAANALVDHRGGPGGHAGELRPGGDAGARDGIGPRGGARDGFGRGDGARQPGPGAMEKLERVCSQLDERRGDASGQPGTPGGDSTEGDVATSVPTPAPSN